MDFILRVRRGKAFTVRTSSDSLNVRDILSGSECLQSCSNHKFEETEKIEFRSMVYLNKGNKV